MPPFRITVQTQAVLAVFLGRHLDGAEEAGDLWGFELSRASGLPAGTIYPILQRLTAAGWVSDRWEDPAVAHEHKRPPRRYYRLTVQGRARAIHALDEASTARSSLTRLLDVRPNSGNVAP